MAEEKLDLDESLQESDEDSAAYTSEREKAASEKLELQQEQARQQFGFLGEDDPDVEIPDPKDRPVDTDSMSDAEVEALETQDDIASPGYSPRDFGDYLGDTVDSPDINEDAKEFQLPLTGAPDEFTGPQAAEDAAASGFNPRSVATSTDPDGLVGDEETVEDITGRKADDIREEQGGMEPSEESKPKRQAKVSKSSPEDAPNTIEK